MQRRHDLDALRVIAFAFLILYHLAMAYVADWGWHVKSSYQSELLQWPMLFINRWRMSLLFLISGAAIALAGGTARPGRFARSRTKRLLLPLLFGMAAIVPVQAYCQGVANGLVQPGFGQFLVHYFSFQPWPKGAFDGAAEGITWNHLWYVAYLWVYTLILMAALPLGRTALAQRIARGFADLRGARLLVLPALPLVLYLQVLAPFFDATNNLTWDWFQHAEYFTVFLYGYLLARADGMAPQRYYSLSAQIQRERKAYYEILERTQTVTRTDALDVTPWLAWFLAALERAVASANDGLDAVLRKARFWQRWAGTPMNPRQTQMLNRWFDGFDGKLSSGKWAAMAQCSPDTALRDINELLALGVLRKLDGGGRSTAYEPVAG